MGRRGGVAAACHAAELNLYLFANGDVGPCCRTRAYGNVATQSLQEIWDGARRAELRAPLAAGRFPRGCELCAAEHRIEGPNASFTSQFQHWRTAWDVPAEPRWPSRIEFELSNRCNLQCVQCNGDLSSAIRSQRERRSPMPAAYGDRFFEELRPFLAHLRSAAFVGGEPFLSPECQRVWDMIAEVAPELDCVVVTNGTQWNDRVERVMHTIRVHPHISLDGITAATYESIRIGADFDAVMAHLERFRIAAARRDTSVSLVFCVLPGNVHELPLLMEFAEERDLTVITSVVREPAHQSVALLPPEQLDRLLAVLESHDERLRSILRRNLDTWNRELERVRGWRDAAVEERVAGWDRGGATLLMFRRDGDGPVDLAAVRSTLQRRSDLGEVAEARIGSDGRVIGARGVAAVVGLPAEQLEGAPLAILQQIIRRYEIVVDHADHYEASIELDGGDGVLVIVPERDERGRADALRLWAAPRTGPARSTCAG